MSGKVAGMKVIDLRSDTITLPTDEMRRAMYEAEVGDDVHREDPTINRLEELAARVMGKESALFTTSGTMSNLLGVLTNTRPGDEIIVSPITFAATANAVVYCGGRPVFADIREDTANIDISEIEKRLTPRTRAILPVDFAGHPADLDEIVVIARDRKLVVIEDACHALGAEYRGRKTGSLADMTVFSFHPVKHITTGEGGMVLTNSDEYYQNLKTLRQHGIVRGTRTGQYQGCPVRVPLTMPC